MIQFILQGISNYQFITFNREGGRVISLIIAKCSRISTGSRQSSLVHGTVHGAVHLIQSSKLRLAATHEPWVQATGTNRVLFADPGNETLQPQPITTMRRRTVSKMHQYINIYIYRGHSQLEEPTYFRCSVYQ